MKKNTLFTIFICSILLSGSFFAISSFLNFSPFVFAQEQEAESTTDPPADTSTTDPPADTSTTDPPADTSTTNPPADTSTTDPPADTSTTDPPADTSTTDPPADTSTTDPPADTSTTDPPADTSTTDPPADTSTTDPPTDTPTDTSSTDPSTVTLQHEDVEINQPVQWTATVDVADPLQTIAVEVPSDAQNTLVMNSDGQIVVASLISDPSLLDTTTNVAEITDPQVMEENAETDLVVVDEPGQILNIEFETSAPYTEEADVSNS